MASDTLLTAPPRPPQAVPDTAESRYRSALLWTAVAAAVFAAWLTSGIGSTHTRRLVSDLVFVVAPLVAAHSCWRADALRRGRHSGWRWIMVGCLLWAAGSVAWTGYFVLGQPAPFPSLADLAYVGYAVPVAVGVTRFPCPAETEWAKVRLLLDGLVIAGCLLLVSGLWVLQPIMDATTMTFTRVDALAYPLADVTVAAIVLTRSTVFPRSRRRVWWALSSGLLVLALTDSVYASSTFRGHFRPGTLLDLGWLLAFGLVALAARAPDGTRPLQTRAGDADSPTLGQQLLPYAVIAVAGAALAVDVAVTGTFGAYGWIAVPLGLLVAARQVVVVADHAALTRSLSLAVEERTTELQQREQWWREILHNLTDVVVVIDPHGIVLYCSPSLEAVLGHFPELTTSRQAAGFVHPDDLELLLDAMRPVIEGRARQGFAECRLATRHGGWGWFEVTAVGQLSEQVLDGAVITLHDVSERRRLTDRLAHQAYHDALTGLPNRAMLMQRVDAALSSRLERRFALLLVDLDDFKVINDRHGHASGDVVLQVIGGRLAACVDDRDVVARLGGDEFALLVNGDPAEVRARAERIAEEIALPVVTGGRRFLVRGSIGVVLPTEDEAESPHSLLSHADIALYEAKAHDKGGIVVIDGAQRAAAAHKVHLREQIAQPDLDQFSVVYQPLVDLVTGHMRGVEALLRWQHPDLGNVAPDVFIPMAEHGGSIQRLGWFVLEEACRQLVAWRQEAPGHRIAVGVNVSIRQLDEPGFAERALAIVAEHGIDPDQIVLELTEQSLAVDFETAVEVVAELRAGGLSVAVDDYGTGYSSLQYLHRFEADVVKIDRSFIANLEGSVHTQKIVAAVVDMAASLDLQCIAEGIETPAQAALVRGLGCELGQGYLFSRPVPPEAIGRLMSTGQLLPVAV